MAEALVGGAFLSATLQVLFDRLAHREVLDYLGGKKFNHGLLKKLKIMLLSVNSVLNDAEEKQIADPAVKEWLDELEDAAYDADDILDEIATDALQYKLEAESRTGTSSKVSNMELISPNSYVSGMENRLKEILEQLEFIAHQKDLLGLKVKEGVGEKPIPRSQTTSVVEESEVFGRDGDKNAIIKLLLAGDEGSNNKVSVIPIVGMGGVGKTTLAQLVYNDEKVEKYFELKSWVCVSEEFNIYDVTKTVLAAVTSPHSYDSTTLDLLQNRLKEKLLGKKFLIVLDDMWNENYNDWKDMSVPFNHGARGSKIIVTTRNENVARIMRTVPIHYHLEHLTDEDCWKLFAKHAFDNLSDSSVCQVLETIGKRIVKKCNGLPLAAKTLGGLLRYKEDVGEWLRIEKSEIWDFSYKESKILPVLMLSYHYLPSYLKRCFAFCSIFPKYYKFKQQSLVLLWMAENLLQQSKTNKRSMEEVGDEYFNELVSMSFFQRLSAKEHWFFMHDLVHDLAKYVSREYCFTLEYGKSEDVITMKVRHLVFAWYVPLKRLDSLSRVTRLRTFLPLQDLLPFVSNEVVNEAIKKLRCLRVLKLSGCGNLNQLHGSIGDLKHLRYLDLSSTPIKRLPESVSMLYNLQMLNLSNCYNLIQLPKNMHHLINLRHLNVRGCNKLKEMPRHINKLKSLQRLSTFIVGKGEGAKIGE
ncbi:putative disease resistance RPP13-like protein 1 [Ziziphus jujuba]|uniref:Disease resistance RPP13-like protein 1 n=1 Tax=Ziziphus jujuba TaxID=326968 RepID=A0ABM3I1F5_ZIZJJ|nr:putative disease resistance RPP13-like protein 1 [Ziziphus jujuba]